MLYISSTDQQKLDIETGRFLLCCGKSLPSPLHPQEEEEEGEAVPEFVAEDEIEESDLSDMEVRQYSMPWITLVVIVHWELCSAHLIRVHVSTR